MIEIIFGSLIILSPIILMAVTAIWSRRRLVLITSAILGILLALGIAYITLIAMRLGNATSPGTRQPFHYVVIYFWINIAAWVTYLIYLPFAFKRAALHWQRRI